MRGLGTIGALTLAAVAAFSTAALAQENFNFMPKGAKALLPALASTPDALRKIGTAKRTEAQWREFVTTYKAALSERDINELTAYLAINMPVASDALPAKADSEALLNSFPQDGRELAWFQCQSCHSLFTGYLMQSRDLQGWRSVFLSPFHRGIKMSEEERETFASYSALSMPMKIDDVPQDLRF